MDGGLYYITIIIIIITVVVVVLILLLIYLQREAIWFTSISRSCILNFFIYLSYLSISFLFDLFVSTSTVSNFS